jgi:hypothetical protein
VRPHSGAAGSCSPSGQAVDADYGIRRAQGVDADRIEGSAQMLRTNAADADRALRALYRGFTETS